MKYEFEEEDTWDMSGAMAPAIRDGLKIFKEVKHGLPLMTFNDVKEFEHEYSDGMGYTSKDAWNYVLDEMIHTFDSLAADAIRTHKEEARVHAGLKLFAKYYRTLWT